MFPSLRSKIQNSSDCKVVIQNKAGQTPIFLEPDDHPFEFQMGWLASKKMFVVFRSISEV